ncbi:porin family protein [Bacteroides sp.]|uniref:porin family protein n=1 Tax=Bacteroides sp. TaxID=29523 RepID=UPI001B57CE27|nr:porin family protein [Bacteroides sp.]MBP6066417.1 porin family protein [Bacteroides sp.]MBP6067498.1 porin family protein [Bacteroides sp.]MBP6936436.1 porin family protein [Bacteroides sp.]MBP8621740.1 porin family protein [Bacteroides sp.]MBP9586106.1 porin family protein [Bacteroides sp.]
MKKMISALLVAICLVMAMPAQAQLKFGVKGGLNLAKADFNKSDLKTDNFTGFFIGPMAELTIPIVGLGVDGALLFSQRGIKLDGQSEKENGLEIPVNLKYTIGLGSLLGIYVAAGPDFYFNFAKDKSLGQNLNLNRKNAQVGINLGAGVKLLKHLQVGFNYNVPLGDSFTVEDATTALFSSKTKVWQVSAAYLF